MPMSLTTDLRQVLKTRGLVRFFSLRLKQNQFIFQLISLPVVAATRKETTWRKP